MVIDYEFPHDAIEFSYFPAEVVVFKSNPVRIYLIEINLPKSFSSHMAEETYSPLTAISMLFLASASPTYKKYWPIALLFCFSPEIISCLSTSFVNTMQALVAQPKVSTFGQTNLCNSHMSHPFVCIHVYYL